MARRDDLSEMDRLDQSWLRRAALYFLSAAFVDAWRGAHASGARKLCAYPVHPDNPNACRRFGICVAAEADDRTRSDSGLGVLCDQCQRAADHLYSERFYGTTGVRLFSVAAAGGAAARRVFRREASDGGFRCAFRFTFCGRVVIERTRGRDCQPFDGVAV